jgi:hypothetical protein
MGSYPKSRSEELIQPGVPNTKCNALLFLAFGTNRVLKTFLECHATRAKGRGEK